MLKMEDDPDELLKTKVGKNPKNMDPDELLKTKNILAFHHKCTVCQRNQGRQSRNSVYHAADCAGVFLTKLRRKAASTLHRSHTGN
jgi:hypothetical protein